MTSKDKDKDKDEIRKRLSSLVNFLNMQSLSAGDDPSWAANCIQLFLDGDEKTLDHAFGLHSSKRGLKPMESGEHDDWVVAAWQQVLSATPEGKMWPDTKTLAKIGRYFELGEKDNENTEDHIIASELKRTIIQYGPIIVKQLSEEIIIRVGETEE